MNEDDEIFILPCFVYLFIYFLNRYIRANNTSSSMIPPIPDVNSKGEISYPPLSFLSPPLLFSFHTTSGSLVMLCSTQQGFRINGRRCSSSSSNPINHVQQRHTTPNNPAVQSRVHTVKRETAAIGPISIQLIWKWNSKSISIPLPPRRECQSVSYRKCDSPWKKKEKRERIQLSWPYRFPPLNSPLRQQHERKERSAR